MVDIEVRPVGGFSDFGRNMTCLRVGKEAVLFDMGIRLDRVLLDEETVFDDANPLDLQRLGAIPDDTVLKGMDAKVVAIIIGHAHLDHVGAVPKLAPHYPDAPIYAAPYTAAFIEDQVTPFQRGGKKGKKTIPNEIKVLEAGAKTRLTEALELEFVHTTHSIPDTVFPVVHTKEGAIVYACDFKFDNTPVIGKKPDYKRLSKLGREGVIALVTESTNANLQTKTPSERIARDMLEDILFGVDNEEAGLIISTFSSHVARVKSIIEFGMDLDRKIVLLGRSMDKYQRIAARLGMLELPKEVELAGHGRAVRETLKRVGDRHDEYLLVGTGHQGEPGSFLTRLADKDLPYDITKNDQIIFSSNTIPHPVNVANRHNLETKLMMRGARIIEGAHVSGHASRVDHQELLRLLHPQHVFPNHGGIELQAAYVDLAAAEGYRLNKNIHILGNGDRYKL